MDNYNATFTSVWDGGIRVNSRCTVDVESRMITAMGPNDIGDNEEMLDCLDRQFVVVDGDNTEYEAMDKSEAESIEPNKFYYE